MNTSVHIVCPHCHTTNRLPASRVSEHPNCGKCQMALFEGKPVALGQQNFAQHIEKSDIPILVDFWAEWCGPCKMMAPHFAAAAKTLEPSVRLAKVDVQSEQMLAARYSIQGIPALVLFKQGKELARTAGVMSAQDLTRWVTEQLR